MNINGYETITTFWSDFTVAEKFGETAIRDTYKRAFSEWKANYMYLTELVLVLNWKIWDYYQSENKEFSVLYNEL